MINIKGIDKAAVLAALYNASSPRGLGFLQAEDGDMSMADARAVIDKNPRLYFDYVHGRPLKIDLKGDELDPRLYERDNGSALEALRAAGLLT